jgi:hypothetical protein
VVRRRSNHTQVGDQALGLLDTSEGTLSVAGTIGMTDETLALHVKTDAKHFKIGSLPAPIDIGGTLKKPTIKEEVDDTAGAGRAGATRRRLTGAGSDRRAAGSVADDPIWGRRSLGVGDHNECAKHLDPVAYNGTDNHPLQ